MCHAGYFAIASRHSLSLKYRFFVVSSIRSHRRYQRLRFAVYQRIVIFQVIHGVFDCRKIVHITERCRLPKPPPQGRDFFISHIGAVKRQTNINTTKPKTEHELECARSLLLFIGFLCFGSPEPPVFFEVNLSAVNGSILPYIRQQINGIMLNINETLKLFKHETNSAMSTLYRLSVFPKQYPMQRIASLGKGGSLPVI